LEIRKLKLNGTFEVKPRIDGDMRGYFAEVYIQSVFEEHGLQIEWVQENQSLSTAPNTVRGLHFQAPPFAQAKMVRTPVGRVLDVFVDIREGSPTYGQWDSLVISDEKCNALYISRGFAHGFCTLTDNVLVHYKVDNVYSPESEGGIRWNDTDLNIDWGVDDPKISERDLALGNFSDFVTPFR